MRLLVGLCLLSLTSCWLGGPFYRASDAREVIPPGVYEMSAPNDDELGPMRVTLDEDGLTILMPLSRDGRPVERDALTVGLTPLGDNRHSVIWFSGDEGRELFDGQSPYGLLIREDRDLFRIAFPACEATEALARAGGAEVNSNETTMCRFSSRRGLETSLLSYAPNAEEAFRLTPLKRE